MTDLAPQTPIETLLKAAMDGSVPIRAFMEAFVASEVVLLTGSLVTPDGSGFDPLLFDKQGTLHVAVFTDPSRVGIYSQQAEHQIDRHAVSGIKRNRRGQPQKCPNRATEIGNPGMRDRHTAAKTGAAQFLTLFDAFEHQYRIEPVDARESLRKLLKNGLLAVSYDSADGFGH
mgnify:CR=1 FL=1